MYISLLLFLTATLIAPLPVSAQLSAMGGGGLTLTPHLAPAGDDSGTSVEQNDELATLTTLLHSMEAMEQLNIPHLPSEYLFDPRTLPTFAERPAPPPLPLPKRAKASPLATSGKSERQRQLQQMADRIWQRLLYIQWPTEQVPEILQPWQVLLQLWRPPLSERGEMPPAPSEILRIWQEQYPHHPARRMADKLQLLLVPPPASEIQRIAVLLPLSGAMQPAGQLVSTGIRIAWFHLPETQKKRIELLFLDSNESAQTLVNQVISSRVHRVIGPLHKERVAQFAVTLAENPNHPPVLLLNQAEGVPERPGFWQFAIPVEMEVEALVDYARSQGLKRAGALMSETHAGLRAGAALEAAWLEWGGEWIGTELISRQEHLVETGRDLMLLDVSSRRNALLQRITGMKYKHIPRQRQDLDLLFIAAPGRRGHQVTAVLAYNYLKGVPLYSLSSIYQPENTSEFDLESVTLMHMPWILHSPKELGYTDPQLEQVQYRKRLVAFGVDALEIAVRQTQLPLRRDIPHLGTTGVLTGDEKLRHIIWKPTPVTVKRGKLVPINP